MEREHQGVVCFMLHTSYYMFYMIYDTRSVSGFARTAHLQWHADQEALVASFGIWGLGWGSMFETTCMPESPAHF